MPYTNIQERISFQRRWRERRIANHQCTRCAKLLPENHKLRECDECVEYRREYRRKNLDRIKSNLRKYRIELKSEIIIAYGGKCACCGESHSDFLTVDHKNNDGAIHRKKVSIGKFYTWLKRNNYPPEFQILCWNCNMAKAHFGSCPHQRGCVNV